MKKIATIATVFSLVLVGAFSLSEYIARQLYPQKTATPMQLGSPFSLVSHTGEVITEQAFQGTPSAVFFGFTHCPEICPTTLNDLANARQALAEGRDKLQIVFITLDPERDTVDVLKDFIPYFGDQVTGITGKPQHVLQLAKDWGIFWERIETSGGGYTLNHTSTIFLLNGQGRMTGTIDISEPTDVVEDKLKKLVARL